MNLKLKVGVSSCLIGEKVRFNGDHKQDLYVKDVLSQFVQYVPVCPEVEVGMGVPRESVHLQLSGKTVHMVGNKSEKDWTDPMNRYIKKRVEQLKKHDLDGYICKKNSPSCGMERIKVVHESGGYDKSGVGMFIAAFQKEFPLTPVEEEGRLNDERLRENFIIRLFSYHRLKEEVLKNFSPKKVIDFHTRHKYLLMAHSVEKYKELGRLVAAVKKQTPSQFKVKYSVGFMEALKSQATPKKNTNVLQHIMGYFKEHLTGAEKQELLGLIEEYRRKVVPLIVPLTLIKHYVSKYEIAYIKDQVYLNPHPYEVKLRYRV